MEHPFLARELAIQSWFLAAIALTLFVLVRNLPNVKPGAKAMALTGAGFIAANALRQSLMWPPGVFPLMWMTQVPPVCMIVIGIITLLRPDENRYVWLTSYVSLAASALTVIGVLIR